MSLDTTADDDEIERCIACAKPFLPGDQVLSDAGGGLIHAACCGPERESYVGADGEPLKDGEFIPTPWAWQPELRKCPHCGRAVSIEPSHNAPDTLYVFACPESSPCRNSGLGTYAIASQLPQAIAAWNRRASSLSEAGGGIDAAVADVEAKLPGAFWHVAKGRVSAKEPLYAAGIFFGEQELGVAETDISPAEAIRLATARALSGNRSGEK